jgi:hypothetical protein
MSDYLWDKTGEADPEVERLESLLGGLAHGPRPLVLPAVAESRPRRAPWLKYAAAAAVLLAVVAGSLVALRLAGTNAPGPVARTAPQADDTPREAATPAAPTPEHLVNAPPETPAPRRVPKSAGKPRRERRQSASGPGNAREVAAEGQRAKEQLMYALRLTGVKLEEVRRKVRGEEDAEGSPEERGRTR